MIDHYRMRRQVVSLEDAAGLASAAEKPEKVLEAQSEFEGVRAAMQQLTEDQCEVLVLRFIAEFDTDQIAQRLGKSQGAVRALQMRALQALAKLMNVKDRQQVKE